MPLVRGFLLVVFSSALGVGACTSNGATNPATAGAAGASSSSRPGGDVVATTGGRGGNSSHRGGGSAHADPLPTGEPVEGELRINETVQWQTMDGMGACSWPFVAAGALDWRWEDVSYVHEALDVQYVRIAPWFGHWEGDTNDNDDPNEIDWSGFGANGITNGHDIRYMRYLDELGIEVMPGIWNVGSWLATGAKNDRRIPSAKYPELGESIAAYLLNMKEKGIEPKYAEVQNEPTIAAAIKYDSPQALRDAALAVLDQLDHHGLNEVKLHGPNTHSPKDAAEWAEVWFASERLRSRTVALSYHTWWVDDEDEYEQIREVAEKFEVPVWATENGRCAIQDTKICGNRAPLKPELWRAAWDFALSNYWAIAWSHASRVYHWSLLGHDALVGKSGEKYPTYFIYRHFSRSIVPGSQLLETAAGDSEVLALSFLHPDSTIAVVLMNSAAQAKELTLTSVSGRDLVVSDANSTVNANKEIDGIEQVEESSPKRLPDPLRLTLPADSVTSLRLSER